LATRCTLIAGRNFLPTGSAFDSVISKIGVDGAINQGVDQIQDIAEDDFSCVSAYIVSLLFTFIVLTLYKVSSEKGHSPHSRLLRFS